MALTNSSLNEKIWQLGQAYVAKFNETLGHAPVAEFDEDWISPCELAKFNDELITWQPKRIEQSLCFDNVSSALEVDLHPDISTYFTTMFSEEIQATCEEGHLSLLFAWNEDDFARLQQNIIGHIMMKQKLKQPLTVFFAVTDVEDIIVSIDNDSGEVWAEKVGKKAHKKLANSIAEFIDTLSPHVEIEQQENT